MSHVDWVDGLEIHSRPDGGFGVYDSHGLVAGPYGRKEDALAAALRLPKHSPAASESAPQASGRT